MAGVVLASAALTAGLAAPSAAAAATPASDCGASGTDLCVPTPGLTTGGLMGGLTLALNLTGNNPFFLSKEQNLGLELTNRPWAKTIYKYVDDSPYGKAGEQGDWTCVSSFGPDECRQVDILSYGFGAVRLNEAEKLLWTAAEDGTLTTPSGQQAGLTALAPIVLDNPLTPDGGLLTRFAPILNKLGIDTSLAPNGIAESPDGSQLSIMQFNLSTPYNPLSDFPVTLNPFSLLNSLFATIPPINELMAQAAGPQAPYGFPPTSVWYNTAGSSFVSAAGITYSTPPKLQSDPGAFGSIGDTLPGGLYFGLQGQDYYLNPVFATLAVSNYIPTPPTPSPGLDCPNGQGKCPQNTALPILYPTAALPAIVNPLLTKIKSPYLLGNPLGDVLGPALRILVNIGYNDVVTPEKLDTVDPYPRGDKTYAQEGYNAYDRTYYQADLEETTPFAWFKNPALTPEETKQAYSDALQAFTGALKDQAAKPFFGILVPNPAKAAAGTSATPVAAARAAVSPPAASVAAPAAKPAASTPSSARAAADKGKLTRDAAGGGVKASRTAK